MAASLLAHKLMTLKLDKKEFKKVKWLQRNNTEEMYAAAKVLQRIHMRQDRDKVCRLCLHPGHIKMLDEIIKEVKYVLGIEISCNDGQPQHICNSCSDALIAAARLKQMAEVTQWRLQQEMDIVVNASSLVELDEAPPRKQHGGQFVRLEGAVVREWVCRKCATIFNTEAEFSEHERDPCRRQKRKGFVCEVCGKEIRSLALLKRHKMVHTGEQGEYPCQFCSYRGRNTSALKIHERRHTGERPYACPECPQTFAHPSRLWTHRKTHQPPEYYCHVCNKGYVLKNLLAEHIATVHSFDKPCTCDICGKAFATRKKLFRHERQVHKRPLMRVFGEIHKSGVGYQ